MRYLIVIYLLCSSCAIYNSGIVNTDSNEFIIIRESIIGIPGTKLIKEISIQEAKDFCIKQGDSMNIIKLFETKGPYIFGHRPNIKLTFSCI